VSYLGRVKRDDGYHVEDFELLTTILSAAAWRRFNGPIKLYTDGVGKEYYRRLGMTDLWDGGIDTTVLESLNPSINHDVFWTAGRAAVLNEEEPPFFSLDTDLVVWEGITGLITSEFMALHPEPLRHGVYKPRGELYTPPGYAWDDWDWDTTPCNASLMYVASGQLPKTFCEKAMAFIVGNRIKRESVSRLPVHDVFVAQRLLPMCAKKLGVKLTYFLNWPRPEKNSDTLAAGGRNRLITHVWAYKDTLKTDQRRREAFCKRCVDRIRADFPDFSGMLRHIPSLGPYLA
jgi:hypothetical protein